MFGFRRRENVEVEFYGKLPIAKDYLRLGLGDEPGLRLREWLDTTFSGANRDDLPELAWPMRFVLGDAWQSCFMGTLVPSTDAGGHRAFPFLVGVQRRRRTVLDDIEGAGMAASGVVWRELRAIRERCGGHADGRSMLAAERGTELAIGEATEPPTAIALDAWFAALWPGDGRAGFARDFDRLLTVGGDAPLRLPLAAGGSLRQQVAAWLEVAQRAGLLAAKTCPTLFFPEAATDDASPLFLTVFRSSPRPADGRWLAPPTTEGALGSGDLVGVRDGSGSPLAPGAAGLPPLSASLRAAIVAGLRRNGPAG